MKHGPTRFLLRWFVSSLGLWITAGIFGGISYGSQIYVVIIAGFLLAAINSIIKPLIVILSLPAILFSLGLFMIIINGLMVLLVSWLYPELIVTDFISAILAGMVIGLVHYLVETILEEK